MTFLPSIDTKLNVWTLAAVLTALYTLLGLVRRGWRATLGKRRHLVKAYRRVAPFVRHDYVRNLFGEPAWEHKQKVQKHHADKRDKVVRRDVELTVRTWPLGALGYLVTWCNDGDEVLMYSLTTTSRLFRPHVAIGDRRITLGRTPLAALPDPDPEGFGPWHGLGARRFSYAEHHYFGNPGGYRDWVVGVSDSGSPALAPVGCDQAEWGHEKLADYRRRARINSVLVAGSPFDIASIAPYGIAPDHDRVRLLELRHPVRVAVSTAYWSIRNAGQDRVERRRSNPGGSTN
ncbi:ETEC_3214 domain-containing protein [Streptomyces sp. NPDC002932]|uniref:ETEC_3214 domain-containing protein n=1 Tax=Streptomyces sp. NPDC002932 TaxID=3364672 RepID=UPI0036C1BA85